MYNSFNNMWNWDYIQQQQALQHHQNQVYQIADCAKKLKDFLESAEKIDPSYEKPLLRHVVPFCLTTQTSIAKPITCGIESKKKGPASPLTE